MQRDQNSFATLPNARSRDFQMLTGLKINFNKSLLYVSKKHMEHAGEWAAEIGCGIGTWPLNYLGITIGSTPKSKGFWRPITKKVTTKLSR